MEKFKDLDARVKACGLHRMRSGTIKRYAGNVRNYLFKFFRQFRVTPAYISKNDNIDDMDIKLSRILIWRFDITNGCSESSIITLFESIKLFYGISHQFHVDITRSMGDFKRCSQVKSWVKRMNVGQKGSLPINLNILKKLLNDIDECKRYSSIDACTLKACYIFIAQGGVRAGEALATAYYFQFKPAGKGAYTFLYNKSKRNQTGLLQSTSLLCTCKAYGLITCAYHALHVLFGLKTFKPADKVFVFEGKPLNNNKLGILLDRHLKRMKYPHKRYSMHGFRRGSAERLIAAGASAQLVCIHHNWASPNTILHYTKYMDPAQRVVMMRNQTKKTSG